MKKQIKIILSILQLLPSFALAQTSTLDSLLSVISNKYNVMGMSVTVTKDSHVVFSQGYGIRDIARSLPVDSNTKYRIASISKTITATAIMQLYERGLFGLNDNVSNYLGFDLKNPIFSDQPITFKMLLSHTSSLRDGSGYDRFISDSYAKTPPPAIRELLVPGGSYYTSNMFDGSLAPNKAYFKYANINFGVLGTLVEKISGERFDIYCRKHIFEPLGMNSSFNVRDLPNINDVAVLYGKSGSFWTPKTDQYNGSYPPERNLSDYTIGDNGVIFAPQGGLRTSSNDLAKFMLANLFGGVYRQTRILNDTTITRMHEIVWRYSSGNGDSYFGIFKTYAIGNHTTTDLLPGQQLIGHPGEAYGLISDMYFSKAGNYGIIFITNGGSWGAGSYCGWYNIEEAVFKACFAELPALTLSVPAIPEMALNYKLEQNYPNPFNSATVIQYSIPRAGQVDLAIFNLEGKLVRNFSRLENSPGSYSIVWDGKNNGGSSLASGIYFYQFKFENALVDTKKLVLIK